MTETCQWNHPRKDGENAAKGTPRTSRKRHSLARWILAALGVVACGTIAAYCFLWQDETVVLPVEEKIKKRGRIPEVEPAKVAKCRSADDLEKSVRRKKTETQLLAEVPLEENVIALSEEDDAEPILFGAVGTYRYCVIDLSRGANARSYPVRCLRNEPKGGFNTKEYKTEKLVLKRVEPGSFIMGGRWVDARRVTLTNPFYMGLFEVTQKQWELVMGTNPCSSTEYGKGDENPVHYVSYNMIRGFRAGAEWPVANVVDSTSFLGKLRSRTKINFDLPTEAQWEYTCRAGTTTKYSYGDQENGDYMWYGDNNGDPGTREYGTKEVGTRLPNNWGFYDMHGNVWESCLDWYGEWMFGTDPRGPYSGTNRVIRGGYWANSAGWCGSSAKQDLLPSCDHFRYGDLGFRICLPSRMDGERADKETGPTVAETPESYRGWIDDFDEAKRLAAKERKLILIDFSGSDWCCWCMKLDEEVFSTEEFMSKASDNFILLMIDSPRDKTRLSEKAAKQNPGLRQRYGIRGYPTVLILDSRGEVLYKTGYRAGGPIAYLKHLEDALGNR